VTDAAMKTRTVNGVELALVDRGSGQVVVLVHGFPLDHAMWDAQVEALSARCRVIAPDLRGFGQSGVTEGTVTMTQFADDLAALLDTLNVAEPVVLCGLSMGGYIAFQFWLGHASRLRGLILCDTRAVADTPEIAAGRLETAERVLKEGPASLVETMKPKLLAEATIRAQPQMINALEQVMARCDPRGIAAAARGMAQRPDMTSHLGHMNVPTLVIVGEDDIISPPQEMWAIASAIPGARFVEIAGSGHMSPVEKPAEFNATVLEFLAGLR